MFRSRHKKARPQDIARGEQIIKSHCYPYWKRMIDPVQNMSMFSVVLLFLTFANVLSTSLLHLMWRRWEKVFPSKNSE